MRVMSCMCSGASSFRFEPRLRRIFRHIPLASISRTFPRRASGFRLLTIQT